MTKVIVSREILFQLAARAEGGRRADQSLCNSDFEKVRDAARAIADATAIPENGQLEIVITE